MTIRTTWRSTNSQGPTVNRRYSAAVTAQTLVPEDTPFAPLDWGLLLGAASIWGGSFLFMAIGLDAFEPGLVTFLRVAVGAATLLLVPSARVSIPRADMGRIALLGITWMAFPLTMFPIAQQWIDSSVAGMLNAAMPLLTVTIAWLGFRTPTTLRRLVGVGVGIVGILLIGVPEATTAGTNAVGVGLVVLAVASYGIAVNIAGPLQQRHGALPVTARALSFATILTLPYGAYGLADSSFAWDSLLACVAVGALGTGVAFTFAATLTGRVGAVRTSIITYVVPVVSIALGVVFRNETVSALAIIGTGIVLCGAWLSSRTA
jgi:drug/metabolite transporter (DMT)-like permease